MAKDYSGAAHMALTNLICVSVIAGAAGMLKEVTPWELIAVPLSFLFANAFEYLMHRHPMHRGLKGLKSLHERHINHHRFFSHELMLGETPRDFSITLFPTLLVVFLVGVFTIPVGWGLSFLFSRNVGLLFVITATAYVLNYEWLHLLYHTPFKGRWMRNPLIEKLRNHHRVHHNPSLMSRHNFNISYPLMDWILGTTHQGK